MTIVDACQYALATIIAAFPALVLIFAITRTIAYAWYSTKAEFTTLPQGEIK